jgi:histidinol-phosphate aminotransferase
MSDINIDVLVRKNIRDLVPYASARSENDGSGTVYLDANENSFGASLNGAYNRYPDPLQTELKKVIGKIKGIDPGYIFLGNGSDEPIDLLIRSFCEPGKDNIITFPPTYGMYGVSANINDAIVKEVLLTREYQIDVHRALAAIDEYTKLIFICSPNNPTGNLIDKKAIVTLVENFKGLVVLDEAYIDFASGSSLLGELSHYQNLIILQTLSKAWGLAALRLGMAFASPKIIAVLNKVKPPYNINLATQQLALEALQTEIHINDTKGKILAERRRLANVISALPVVQQVFPSDANFILIRVTNAAGLYSYLKERGIIVRNRSSAPLCENTLRITVGTDEENDLLINALKEYTNA